MSKNYSQLNLDERRTIHRLSKSGKSKTEIAEHLGGSIIQAAGWTSHVSVYFGILYSAH